MLHILFQRTEITNTAIILFFILQAVIIILSEDIKKMPKKKRSLKLKTFWVTVDDSQPVCYDVATSGCLIHLFMKMKEILPKLATCNIDEIVIRTANGTVLRNDHPLADLEANSLDTALRASRSSNVASTSSNVDILCEKLSKTHISCKTMSNQGSASSFSKVNQAHGFGSLPTSFHFDPTCECRIYGALVPTNPEVEKASSAMPLAGENATLLWRGEDSANGIRAAFDNAATFLGIDSNGRDTLMAYGLSVGLASAESYPDHVWRCSFPERILLGNIEFKDGSLSALPALRQAYAAGTNIAVGLLNRGISCDDCIVPICGCNGMLLQFGAIMVLQPSFPTMICTSKVLDVADFAERQTAMAYLAKAKLWTDRLVEKLASAKKLSTPITTMELYRDCYHIKVLTSDVLRRGLGLFADRGGRDPLDIGKGLEHMGRALNMLFALPELRKHVVFPLAVRSPDSAEDVSGGASDESYFWLVYQDLRADGYCMGTPDRTKDPELYAKYIEELWRVVGLIHAAGVIHCDLYPSNIMWRALECPTEIASASASLAVDIKIIDWDCSHCLGEREFYPAAAAVLEGHEGRRNAVFGIAHDEKYLEVLSADMIVGQEEFWSGLSSNNKELIDKSFFALFSSFVRRSI